MTTNAPKPLAVVKQQPLRQCASVRELLVNDQAREQLAAVAAKHLNPERMMKLIANAIRTTPKLAECEPMSLLGALMTCASLGLEPNTVLGHAYLIPFNNKRKGVVEVQLVIGYKGLADLARRSGQIIAMHADVVYSDDALWSFEYGSDAHLRHKPGPRRGEKTHAYCHVKMRLTDERDGEAFVVLPWAEIMKTRDQSQGWQTAVRFGKTAESPWTVHEDRMAAKTAVRRMANAGEMPLSIEFQRGLEVDEKRADYGAFALDPKLGEAPVVDMDVTAGVPEGDIEIVDGETGEVTSGPAQVEHKPEMPMEPVKLRPEPEPVRTAAPRQQQAAKPAPAAGIPEELESVLSRIEGDLADIKANPAAVETTLEMWAQEIGRLRAYPAAAARLDAATAVARGEAPV